jgi:hypothetical protein
VIVGRLDAVVIFQKWSSECTLVRCQATFASHAFAMEGTIKAVSGNEVQMIAGNELTQLVVKLADDLHFNYADSREVTGDEAENYPCCLGIAYEPIPDEGPADMIAFAEISPARPF